MSGILQVLAWNALEASVLALAVALLTATVRMSPPSRHLLWLLVVLKLLLPPVGVHSLGLSGACERAAACMVRSEIRRGAPPSPEGAVPPPAVLPDEPLPVDEVDPGGEGWWAEPAAALLAGPEPAIEPAAAPTGEVIPGFLAVLWILASSIVALRQARKVLALRALVRGAEAAPREVEAECAGVARRLRLRRAPQVRVLPESFPPMVWSLGRPVVVLPRGLLAPARRTVLRNVLAHELAHVKRRDPWISWIELLGTCLYFWLPALWWARSRLRRAADQSCDAWAVSALGSRKEYAESLLAAVQLSRSPDLPLPALGMGSEEGEAIKRRLIMIMRGPLSLRPSWPACLGIFLAGLLALPAAPRSAGAQESSAGAPPAAGSASEPAASEPALAPPGLTPAPTPAPAPTAGHGEAGPLPEGVIEPPSGGSASSDTKDGPAERPQHKRFKRFSPGTVGLGGGAGAYALAGGDDSTERRLSDLEGKMDRILEELAALRNLPKVDPNNAYGRRTAAVTARREKPTVRPAPRTTAENSGVPAPGMPPRAGVTTRRAPRPLAQHPLSPEKRDLLEKLNRDFEDRMMALREEHRAEVRKLVGEGFDEYDDDFQRAPEGARAVPPSPAPWPAK